MLIYGVPGAGKTRLIGEASAVKSLIIHPPTDHTDSIRSGSADEWVVEDWSDMEEVLLYMRGEGAAEYDWLWLDSISLFQKSGLDDLWATVIEEKPTRARYGPDKSEYGINMDRLGRWVRHLVGAPGFNVGITAHPFWGENLEGEQHLMPFVQGRNMPEQICGYMNVVAYLDLVHEDDEGKQPKRVLRTWATDQYYAKDQFDAFDKGRLEDPTMDEILSRIEASRARPRRAAAKKKRPTAARRKKSSTTKRRRS